MKQKLLVFVLLLGLLLTGCGPSLPPADTDGTTLSTETTAASTPETPGSEATDPLPSESQATQPGPDESNPTAPAPTESKPTDPAPTESKPTEPKPSESEAAPSQPTETTPTAPPATDPVLSGKTLTVHYIDVGQADSILLECDGKFMIIDGGNVADSSLVVTYLQDQGVQELEAVVCTHAHEDHVGGLPGVLAVYPTKKVYAPTKTYSSKCFDDFVRYTDQQGLDITIPKPGDSFRVGEASVTVLGPVTSYSETNNTSIVLLVQFGTTRFLFTGDMEAKAETDMLNYWDGKRDLTADVLKVGHHGSSTSTGYRFLYEVDPLYAVISVGKDNQFNHPNEEPMSRLEDGDVTIHRTDKQGHILAVSNGADIAFSWGNGAAAPETPENPREDHTKPIPETTEPGQSQIRYIGNKNSKTLHLPTCSSLPSEANRVYFDDYEEAIAAGYHACSRCKPAP